MRLSSSLAILVSTRAAVALPRTLDEYCFRVSAIASPWGEDADKVLLGSEFQHGEFCLDRKSKMLRNSLGHNCFMESPDYRFECHDGATGRTTFDISHPAANGVAYLAYDKMPGIFYACPSGTEDDYTFDIFAANIPFASVCMPVVLRLDELGSGFSQDETSSTAVSSSAGTNGTQIAAVLSETLRETRTRTTTIHVTSSTSIATSLGHAMNRTANHTMNMTAVHTSMPKTALPTRLTDATGPVSTQTCSVSPAATSIPPSRVGPEGALGTSGEIIISQANSTVFEFTIPQKMDSPTRTTAHASKCALQFRMPFCSDLPEGYPCYEFTGLEQEMTAKSGMHFELLTGGGNVAWDKTALHQVFPGETSIIGTFDCGASVGSQAQDSIMSWRATSINGFGLEFLQAGVGDSAEFDNGIGLWIVPCQ